MRQSGERRDQMQFGSDAPASPGYAVGDRVCGALDGCPGTVVSVSSVVAPLISVVWDDGDGKEIIYPADTIMIRRLWPWG